MAHGRGFLLSTRTGVVVAGEGEEDEEPDEDREPGREHTEDARGAVPVVEVTAVRGATTNEQHRRDRDARGDDDHAEPDEEVHVETPFQSTLSPASSDR